MLAVFLFAGIGNASTFKQIPMIFQPRQAAGVIGWTAAIAAYGPFVFAVLIAAVIDADGVADAVLPRRGGLLRRQHRDQLVVLPAARCRAAVLRPRWQ